MFESANMQQRCVNQLDCKAQVDLTAGPDIHSCQNVTRSLDACTNICGQHATGVVRLYGVLEGH